MWKISILAEAVLRLQKRGGIQTTTIISILKKICSTYSQPQQPPPPPPPPSSLFAQSTITICSSFIIKIDGSGSLPINLTRKIRVIIYLTYPTFQARYFAIKKKNKYYMARQIKYLSFGAYNYNYCQILRCRELFFLAK